MFEHGQMVVCVDDDFSPPWWGLKLPKLGQIYTIRDFNDDYRWGDGAGALGIYLQEIVNHIEFYEDDSIAEPPFWAGRFRPVRKTDISAFTSILEREGASA